MQTTKQQTVKNFLNKQANARNTQYGVIITTPIVIAFAGFFGAFDALVK